MDFSFLLVFIAQSVGGWKFYGTIEDPNDLYFVAYNLFLCISGMLSGFCAIMLGILKMCSMRRKFLFIVLYKLRSLSSFLSGMWFVWMIFWSNISMVKSFRSRTITWCIKLSFLIPCTGFLRFLQGKTVDRKWIPFLFSFLSIFSRFWNKSPWELTKNSNEESGNDLQKPTIHIKNRQNRYTSSLAF